MPASSCLRRPQRTVRRGRRGRCRTNARKIRRGYKKSHATSVAIILPASVVSAYLYFSAGHLDLARAACYLPGGLIGAAVGAWLLKKIRNKWLKVAFALLIIAGAVRMWFS